MNKTTKKINAWMAALSRLKEPDKEKAKWIRDTLRLKKNLPIFGRYFFPHLIAGEVPDCHADLVRELARQTDSAIVFPRGHAKTTWEKIDTIHDIVYKLEPVILYISCTLTEAQFHFESIKFELENNAALRKVYGSIVPPDADLSRKWTNKHFETTNGVNVVARGARKGRGVNIKGSRPTKIVIDDVENDEAVRSSELREKLDRWIFGVIIPSRDKERGRVKMIGTILHPDASLEKFYNTFGGIKRSAIENGKSIWPQFWPLKRLAEERRAVGGLVFDQEYMNIPITAAARLVKESWIIRRPKPLPTRTDEEGNIAQVVDAFGAADPAISEKETADYTAVATVWRNIETGRITVVDIERGHLSFPDQVRMILRKHRTFNYQTFGIETVAYQKALKQEIDRIGPAENTYVPTTEITVDKDKVRRFLQVLPFIENGTVEFANDLPEEFFAEILAFPHGQHDDMVDAFVHAVGLAIQGEAPQIIQL